MPWHHVFLLLCIKFGSFESLFDSNFHLSPVQTPSRTVGAVQVQVWCLQVGSELWTLVLSSVSTWDTLIHPTRISLKGHTVRHPCWPEPNRKEEHGSDFEVLRQELILMSSESCSRSFLTFSSKMFWWFFWSCGSDRVYIDASDRFEKSSYLSRIYSKPRVTSCVKSWTGSEHICDSSARLKRWTLLFVEKFIY